MLMEGLQGSCAVQKRYYELLTLVCTPSPFLVSCLFWGAGERAADTKRQNGVRSHDRGDEI